MSMLNQDLENSLPSQVYYDVQVSNFGNETTRPNPFHFNDTRNTPYLYNPEGYELSIIRFSVDTGSVPVFIPEIQPDQPDRDLTVYKVSLSYFDGTNTTYGNANVMWRPQDLTVSKPIPPSESSNKLQDNTSGYYNCYSFSWFVELVQQAYLDALNNLKSKIEVPDTNEQLSTPIIYWDTESNKAIIQAQYNFYDLRSVLEDPSTEHAGMFMNKSLYNMFNSFPAKKLSDNDPVNHANYQIEIFAVLTINVAQLQTDPNSSSTGTMLPFVNLPQETSTVFNWSPITALVFTSNTLPVNPNQVSTPLIYNENSLSFSKGGTNSATENIVTDIVSGDGQYRGGLVYTPSAQYRKITLFGNTPLHNLDLNIYYRLKTGEMIPFRLSEGGACTLKMLFEKIK